LFFTHWLCISPQVLIHLGQKGYLLMSEQELTTYEKIVRTVVREGMGIIGGVFGHSTGLPLGKEIGKDIGQKAGKAIDDYGRNNPGAFKNCNRK
jgi:hypothetical protein